MTRRLLGVLLTAVALSGCGAASNVQPATFPPQSFGPSRVPTGAAAATRAVVSQALGTKHIQLRDAQVVFRPPESPQLTAAPRLVAQAVIPEDPNHGYISIYEFADVSAATAAGREEATFIASGPGRVQFTADTRFVLRQVGQTLVFFTWSPGSTSDADFASIQEALETVGVAVPIPS